MNTEMGAHILPAGWSEWQGAPTQRLDTATYAEFNSSGPGAESEGAGAVVEAANGGGGEEV